MLRKGFLALVWLVLPLLSCRPPPRPPLLVVDGRVGGAGSWVLWVPPVEVFSGVWAFWVALRGLLRLGLVSLGLRPLGCSGESLFLAVPPPLGRQLVPAMGLNVSKWDV